MKVTLNKRNIPCLASGITPTIKSVFKLLTFSTEVQFTTELALMDTQQRIKVDDATQMITEIYLDDQTAVRGNF